MKRIYLSIICLALCYTSFSQSFTDTLSGDPINTTGWIYDTTTCMINGSAFELTTQTYNEAGYIYYAIPQTLTDTSRFTVDFDFQIITSPGNFPGDGMSFWCTNNIQSFAPAGDDLGIPLYVDGLLLVLDTYDNDNNGNNPLEALFGYDGTTEFYTEGLSTGSLGSLVADQHFIVDGSWHHCKLTYDTGNINVYFNDSTTPSITANYPLSGSKYFGFSASTGGYSSIHNIGHVVITNNTDTTSTIDTTGTTDTTGTAGTATISPISEIFAVSPNPNRGNFAINTGNKSFRGKQVAIKLITEDGRTIWQNNAAFDNSGHLNINATGIPAGIYTCELIGDNAIVHARIFVF